MSKRFLLICGLGCFVLMAVVMYILRDVISAQTADLTSYADLAKNIAAGHYHELTNPYWSPLYPALLSLSLPARLSTMEALRNGILTTQVVIHTLYIAALLYFAISFRHLTRLSFAALLVFAMALYLKFAASFTPDQLVAVLTLLALGILNRILQAQRSWPWYAALGVTLGIAYWAKAMMMPASLVLLALFTITQWRKTALVSIATFLLTATPALVLASAGAQRPTFGESGRLNFAWSVNRYKLHRGWRGEEPGSGTPQHPPRVLLDSPLVLEFADPTPGTFPLWYDPALWHRGLQTHLSVPEILAAIRANIPGAALPALFLAISLPSLLLGWRKASLAYAACFFIWPLTVIAAYFLVALELRYLFGIIPVFLIAAVALCPENKRSQIAQASLLLMAGAWMLAGTVSNRNRAETRWSEEVAATHYLQTHGVKKADRLAAVNWTSASFLFLLPLDAQIVTWLGGPVTPEQWTQVQEAWRTLQIKAAIDVPYPSSQPHPELVPGWEGFQSIPETQYFTRILRP